MRVPLQVVLSGLSCVLAAGCAGIASPQARAQEAARELNEHARFGRAELVMERVAAKERADFTKKHRGWGTDVRVADSEMAGFHMTGDSDAEVSVRVGWYRPDEQDLRVTVLRQKWHDHQGSWLLVGEERVEGDTGLLGEPAIRQPPSEPKPPAQFPTIRLGGTDTASVN
jgi:hypothetical protein